MPDGKNFLSKDAILARRGQRRTEDVEVPGWGGWVRVAAMSSYARDQFEQSLMVEDGKKRRKDLKNFRAKLLAACLVDEAGALLFSEEEVVALGQIDAGDMEKVVNVALRLNGFSDDDIAEIAKNSESDRIAVS